LPPTLTKLRGFLGLCNYYEEYVPGYAQLAWRLMEKLKVKGARAKAGSNLPLTWSPEDIVAFNNLKKALMLGLSLHQLTPDLPFHMRTDASDTAIGAVLEQTKKEHWVPICFFSRKLTISQVNWSPREKEAYGIVASLVKWASWIGTTAVSVITDHKSLESWVREYVDTPSGPTGRRARWHEVFSQFQLTIEYQPGSTNIPADAMTRYAYPASLERQDVSKHGSISSAKEAKHMALQETLQERQAESQLCSLCKRDLLSMDIFVLSTRKSRENYRLQESIRDQALVDIGVTKAHITVDLFACGVNACCPLFITKRMNAFSYFWPALHSEPSDILWANPPFSKMEEVVTKLIMEPCRLVLVAPEIRHTSWWKPLDMLTVARVYLPAHLGIYIGDCQHSVLPGPEWRTAVSLVDSTKWHTKPFRQHLVTWVQTQCQQKGLADLRLELETLYSRRVMVTTRSGRDTEDSPENSSDSEQPEPPPPPHTKTSTTPLPPPVTSNTDSDIPQFRFFHQMSPAEQVLRRTARKGKRPGAPRPPAQLEPPPAQHSSSVLTENWEDRYLASPEFSGMWSEAHDPQATWPVGVQLHQGRMYFQGKLCVPEPLAQRLLWEFHSSAGHLGISKMSKEIQYRFIFPPSIDTLSLIQAIRQACLVCQAATPPH
jgi:hypothetical protein